MDALLDSEREVLALLAESGLGYADIAALLGLGRTDVAALAATGRLQLTALPAPDGACVAELPHLAGHVDGEMIAARDPLHVGRCVHCARTLTAMLEADEAYRRQRPGPVPPAVRARLGI